MSKATTEQKTGAFTQQLDADSLARFTEVCKKPFSEQAMFFLDAFWVEYGKEADVIYRVHWDWIKHVDMKNKGIMYIHLYEQGCDLDFDMTLHFFELLAKYYNEDKTGVVDKKEFPASVPTEMTAIVRKKELKDTVDVNFDGRISLLEYLLYQYKASPKELMLRQSGGSLPEEVLAAIRALEEVNKQIRAYESEKFRLEELSKTNNGQGIQALRAINELAQLNSSPLWEKLNKAFITADAAVRIVSRRYGVNANGTLNTSNSSVCTAGTVWWLERELKEKKAKYAKKA